MKIDIIRIIAWLKRLIDELFKTSIHITWKFIYILYVNYNMRVFKVMCMCPYIKYNTKTYVYNYLVCY